MEFKTTSIKRRTAGTTLVEVLVSAGLSSLVLAAVVVFTLYGAKGCAAMGNYTALEKQSRCALDHMTQRIRQAHGVLSFSPTALSIEDVDGTPVNYTFDANARTLSEVKNGTATLLLKDCDQFTFGVFQRTPVQGTYNAYPVATPGTGKLVQMSWVCSRRLLGRSLNSETVQSAKIVIRNQG